jgi:hypothetical protein
MLLAQTSAILHKTCGFLQGGKDWYSELLGYDIVSFETWLSKIWSNTVSPSYPENGGSMFFQNDVTNLSKYAVP